jgi:hypothetical protein
MLDNNIKFIIKLALVLILLILNVNNSSLATSDGKGVTFIRGSLGVKVRNPIADLHVNGTMLIKDGNEQEGYIFISDENGLGSWGPLSSVPGLVMNNGTVSNLIINNGFFQDATLNGTTVFNGTVIYPGETPDYIYTMGANGVAYWAPNLVNGTGISKWAELDDILYPAKFGGAQNVAIGGNSALTADIFFTATGGAIFNQQGLNSNFVVKGVNEDYLLFVHANTDRVGIRTNTPSAALDVGGGVPNFIDGVSDLLVADDAEINGNLYANAILANTLTGTFYGYGDGLELNGNILRNVSIYDSKIFSTLDFNGASMIRAADGPLLINGDTEWGGDILLQAGYKFQVEGPNDSDMTFIAYDGLVGINTANPATALDVNGQVTIRGGSPGEGKLLGSVNNQGLAEWVSPNSIIVGSADYAINAENATTANTADFALLATNAVNAGFATNAENATTANTANLATFATNAENATTANFADSMSIGTIVDSSFLNGVINGATIINSTITNSLGSSKWDEGFDGIFPIASDGDQTVLIGSPSKDTASIVLDSNGTVSAVKFIGDGSGLTNIPEGEWIDTGIVLHPTGSSGAKTVVIGSTTEENANIILGHNGYAVFNEQGLNSDFRIAGQGDAHLFYTQASTDRIGIRTSSPRTTLDINGSLAFKVDIVTVAADTGITTDNLSHSVLHLQNSGSACSINITANPQIAPGVEGQVLTLIGKYSNEELILVDGNGLALNNNISFALKAKDTITFIYSEVFGEWIELSRNNYTERESEIIERGSCNE